MDEPYAYVQRTSPVLDTPLETHTGSRGRIYCNVSDSRGPSRRVRCDSSTAQAAGEHRGKDIETRVVVPGSAMADAAALGLAEENVLDIAAFLLSRSRNAGFWVCSGPQRGWVVRGHDRALEGRL